MTPVLYPFTRAINGCFEVPTSVGQQLIGGALRPVEASYGRSVLAVTLFEFSDSPVGPYQELVFSLFVAPRLGVSARQSGPVAGRREPLHRPDRDRACLRHPHAAVCPIRIASTHDAARRHAIDLWHLPHFMEDIWIDFAESEDRRWMRGTVWSGGEDRILELTVSHSGRWSPTSQLYQSFQRDTSGAYMGVLTMEGELSEHEERTGRAEFDRHPFFEGIDLSQIEPEPIREMWMRNGVESYLSIARCE
jgi:hypothetical protein